MPRPRAGRERMSQMETRTFGAWLDLQAGRDDAVGAIADQWKAAQGERPRRFAFKSVVSWVIEHAGQFEASAPTLLQTMDIANQEYHGTQPPYQPERPGQVPVRQVSEQEYDQARKQAFDPEASQLDEHYRRSTGQEPPPHESTFSRLAGFGEQLGRIEAALAAGQAVDDGSAQAVLERLDRIEGGLSQVRELVSALAVRFGEHEAALEPLRAVLAEIAAADDDEDDGDLGEVAPSRGGGEEGLVSDLLAARDGGASGTGGPNEAYGPGALYGPYGQRRAQPSPSWAAIDAATDPADLREEDQPWRSGGAEPGE